MCHGHAHDALGSGQPWPAWRWPPAGRSRPPPRPAPPSRPAPPAPSPARASGALCSDVAAVTRLVVTRVTALPQNHLHFAVPAGVTVSDPAGCPGRGPGRVRAAGHAAWHRHELPGRPGRQLPAELRGRPARVPGGDHHGRGLRRGQRGRAVRRATSATFWTDLARALGVPHPSSSALQGTS